MSWPSSNSPGTLGYMVDRISGELGGRPDLEATGDIRNAIESAITIYQSERYIFNESRATGTTGTGVTFGTVATRALYGAADNPNLGSMYSVDFVHMLVGTTVRELKVDDPAELELLSQNDTQNGEPERYAYYGLQMRLYPVPLQVYTVRVAGHIKFDKPADLTVTGNPWMNIGERLIRSRAKFELAVHVIRGAATAAGGLAETMSPFREGGAAYDAEQQLKGLTNKMTSEGRVAPMQF